MPDSKFYDSNCDRDPFQSPVPVLSSFTFSLIVDAPFRRKGY